MPKLDDLKSKIVNIDDIIEKFILDKEKSEEDHIGKYEAHSAVALIQYTQKIIAKYEQDGSFEQASKILEDFGMELLDYIYESNRLYTKRGMQIGAHLIIDLILSD